MKCPRNAKNISIVVLCAISAISCSFMSIELTHEETFEVESFEEQDFIDTHDKDLENRLNEEEESLKFQSFRKEDVAETAVSAHIVNTTEDITSDTNFTVTTEEIHTNVTENDLISTAIESPSSRNISDFSLNLDRKTNHNKAHYERELLLLSKLHKILETEDLSHKPISDTETQLQKPRDFNEDVIEEQHKLHDISKVGKRRRKRQIGIDANKGWVVHYTTFNPLGNKTKKTQDSFQVISAKDREKAEQEKIKNVLTYVGSTLLSVVAFSLIAYCFIKNPKACIVSFGTGCPCCLLCVPCCNKWLEKMDPKKNMQENMNKYLPGVIIHEDGTIEAYEASPEEIEIVNDIINEITS